MSGTSEVPVSDLGVLFAEVLVEEKTQMSEHLLLAALLHYNGNARDEISSLLPELCTWGIQTPSDDTANLRKVGFDACAKRVHDGREPVQQRRSVLRRLFLERVQKPVNELLLQPVVHVQDAVVHDDLLQGLQRHFPGKTRVQTGTHR